MSVNRCLFCGGSWEAEFSAREMMIGLREEFTYRRCAECASLWLAEPPADLAPYYGGGYYSFGRDPKGASPIRGARLWANALLAVPPTLAKRLAGRRGFPRYIKWLADADVSLSSRIVDVGCGEGDLICQMSRHGFEDVWGLDPFIQEDRDAGNVHLRKTSIYGAEGEFDFIMFNHSLEHVADPISDLRQAEKVLSGGGRVLVRVPIANSLADTQYGPNWVSLDAPRHFGIPTVHGMRAAAASAGFEIERVFFDSLPLQFWASEQYARDIPLHDPAGGCATAESRLFQRKTAQVNRDGRGDNAGFVLRRTE